MNTSAHHDTRKMYHERDATKAVVTQYHLFPLETSLDKDHGLLFLEVWIARDDLVESLGNPTNSSLNLAGKSKSSLMIT